MLLLWSFRKQKRKINQPQEEEKSFKSFFSSDVELFGVEFILKVHFTWSANFRWKNFPSNKNLSPPTININKTMGKCSMCFNLSCCVVDCISSRFGKFEEFFSPRWWRIFVSLFCCFRPAALVGEIVLLLLFYFLHLLSDTTKKWIKKNFVSLFPPVVKSSETRAGVSSKFGHHLIRLHRKSLSSLWKKIEYLHFGFPAGVETRGKESALEIHMWWCRCCTLMECEVDKFINMCDQ